MNKIIFLLLSILIIFSCEKDDSRLSKMIIPFASNDLVMSWEIVSAEGAPAKPLDTYSIWTFKSDGTYEWYFKYPDYYNLEGTGSYTINNNQISLTGIMKDAEFVNSTFPIYFSEDKKSFSFYDIDGAEFVYQIADTEGEQSKSIPFQETASYSGDCLNKPAGTSCIGYDDGYIWSIPYTINDVANCSGSSNNYNYYYTEGKYVSVRCLRTNSYSIIQCHRIEKSNFVKIVTQ